MCLKTNGLLPKRFKRKTPISSVKRKGIYILKPFDVPVIFLI